MRNKVLMVDDSKVFLELEKSILDEEDYTTIEASNGKEALELAKTELPDLILLDINMPVMNGFEFLVLLRKDERLNDIPVIIVTTRGRDEDVKYALKLGANDYITKPIDNRTLSWKVTTLLNKVKKRSSPRIPLDIEVEFGNKSVKHMGIIKDLGIGGAHIVTNAAVQKLEQYEFYFDIPFEGGYRPVRTLGKIIFKGKRFQGEMESYDIRIQFINLSRDALFFIENVINKDTKSLASFLFTSPTQRQDYNSNTIPSHKQRDGELRHELDTLLDDFYYIEALRNQLLDKYDALKDHLKEIQIDYNKLAFRHNRREEEYLSLSNMFVALYQLFTRNTLSGVMNVLCDIVENLVGVESFDICLYRDRMMCRSLLVQDEICEYNLSDVIHNTLNEGNLYFDKLDSISQSRTCNNPVAAIPILFHDKLIGCIIIARFLPQMKVLNNITLRLCEVLKRLSASAIVGAFFSEKHLRTENQLTEFINSILNNS